jgi:hypothetical protein
MALLYLPFTTVTCVSKFYTQIIRVRWFVRVLAKDLDMFVQAA